MPLDARTAGKLTKALALLGSEHMGERAAAGAAAHRILHEAGWTWADLVAVATAPKPVLGMTGFGTAPPARPPPAARARASWALANLPSATIKERDFLSSLTAWSGPFSERQLAWLNSLVARAAAGRSAPGWAA